MVGFVLCAFARDEALGRAPFYLLPASRRAVITLLIDCSRRRLRRRYLFYGYVYRHFTNACFIASAWKQAQGLHFGLSERFIKHCGGTPRAYRFYTPNGVPPCRFFLFCHCLRIERFSRYGLLTTCEPNTLEYNSYKQNQSCFIRWC